MTYTTVDVDATTRQGRTVVREAVRELAWDREHDPYGSAMVALGAVVDTLWLNGEGVPSAIATPSPGWDGEEAVAQDAHDIDATLSIGATTDDVRYWALVLARYVNVIRLAGRDY